MGWLGPMTHRQFLVWCEWDDQEWDRPSLSDHYAMLVACETRRGYAKDPRRVRLKDMKLSFTPKDPTAGMTAEEFAARSKAIWAGMLQMAGAKAVYTPPPDAVDPDYVIDERGELYDPAAGIVPESLSLLPPGISPAASSRKDREIQAEGPLGRGPDESRDMFSPPRR